MQAIGIITQFNCDTLTNSCGADATAKATCAKAQAAANTGAAKTGAQADLFNAAFGITTTFLQVAAGAAFSMPHASAWLVRVSDSAVSQGPLH